MAKPKRLVLPALLAAAVTFAATTQFCALFLGPKTPWTPLSGTALRAEVGTAEKEPKTTSQSTDSVKTSTSEVKEEESSYEAWAEQAQALADEGAATYEKGGKEAAAGRAQQIACDTAASGLRVAANSPSWAPPAVLATVLLVITVVLGSAFSRPTPSPEVKPSVSSPAPTVVKTQTPAVVQAQKPAVKPSSSNISPKDIDELLTEIDKEVQKPKATPKSSTAASSVKLVPAPTLVESIGQSAASSSSKDLEVARKVADIASAGLRATADGLPVIERAFEGAVPAVKGGINWASDINDANQGQKIREAEEAAAKGAEGALRFGAKAGSAGLSIAAENLPQAGQALQNGIEAAMPTFQAGIRGTASFARDLAKQSADVKLSGGTSSSDQAAAAVVGALPSIFGGFATGLDFAADVAPGVEKVASYVGSAAAPVAQASLSAASKLVGDVSDAPVPQVPQVDPAEVKAAIKKVGVDVDKIQFKLPDISAKLPKIGKAAADVSKPAPPAELSKAAADVSKAVSTTAGAAPRTSVAVLLDP